MYTVTGKARARSNIKILQNIFKYLSRGFMEVSVRWTQISRNTEENVVELQTV